MTGVPPSEPRTISAIIEESAAAEQAKAPTPANELAILAEKVELLTADFGRWEEYKAATAEYVKEFSAEIRWVRIIRAWVAIAAAALVLFFCGGLVAVLCLSQRIFGVNDAGHALTALIVAAIGGSVIIAIATIKGAFRTTVERNEGLPMPEHFKEVLEVGKQLFNR